MISTSNSLPLVGEDRKAFGVWRSAFCVPGARGDVDVLRLRSVVRNSGGFVGQVGVSWRVIISGVDLYEIMDKRHPSHARNIDG